MRILNIILVIVLIFATIYIFHLANDNRKNIIINNKQHSLYQIKIDSLIFANKIRMDEIGVLKDSVSNYKSTVVLFEDSLIQITKSYEEKSVNVFNLNDSSSVEYFKNYLSNYKKRNSTNTN